MIKSKKKMHTCTDIYDSLYYREWSRNKVTLYDSEKWLFCQLKEEKKKEYLGLNIETESSERGRNQSEDDILFKIFF